MDERDWKIISLLYKHKNITKTANELYISQPALTGRIKQIEQDLGVPILNRSNRGVEFTPHGVFVAEFANHLLGEISNFRENLGGLGKDVAGVIKIGATSIIGRYYLPRLLDGFNKKFALIVLIAVLMLPTPEGLLPAGHRMLAVLLFAVASSMISIMIAVLKSLNLSEGVVDGVNIIDITMLLQFVVSFSFVLPVNSPQGILAYATGTFTANDCMKIGIPVTIIGYILLLAFAKT